MAYDTANLWRRDVGPTSVAGMLLTHRGHACIELDVKGRRLLFDPGNFSEFDTVQGVDAVVVTHKHPDHLDPERLDAVRSANPGAVWFADPMTCEQLAEAGITATPTKAGETYDVSGVSLEGVGSTHAEIHPYIDRISNVGIVVTAPDEPRIFHPGDSLEGRPEGIDYLCVPVTAPWQAVKETIAFVREFEPKAIIPIHDRTASPEGRGIYMTHISGYGQDGGVEVYDLAAGESTELH